MEIVFGVIILVVVVMVVVTLHKESAGSTSKYYFDKKYRILMKKMRKADAPDSAMLSCMLLYSIHIRYCDKKSFFYLNNRLALVVFSFIYSNIMLSIQLKKECKKRIENNLDEVINIFDVMFDCKSRDVLNYQYKTYKTSIEEKLNMLEVFTAIVIKVGSTQHYRMQVERDIAATLECQLFFTEVLPTIIESVGKWCEANKGYVGEGRHDRKQL